MPPRKKVAKRNRESGEGDDSEGDDGVGPPTPRTHSAANKATVRDTIVAYGAGHGVLQVPVERRIARYLRQERMYAVGGIDDDDNEVRAVFSLDVEADTWVAEAAMLECRRAHCLSVLHGELWAVGGEDEGGHEVRSCERLDHATNSWVRGPDMLIARCFFGVGVVNGELWAVGGSTLRSFSCERLDTVTGAWVPGPEMTACRNFGNSVAVFRGELWAVGGACVETTLMTSCERLDTARNQWVPESAMTFGCSHFGLAVFRGQLWAVGGMSKDLKKKHFPTASTSTSPPTRGWQAPQ